MTRKQAILLFVIFWLHISLLNLAFIGYNGFVFLWQENIAWQTVVTHLVLAMLAVVSCYLADKLLTRFTSR